MKVSKNDFMKSIIREQNKIRVLFVNMTIDDNAFVIHFKNKFLNMYCVLFINIDFSKHENHDTPKLRALI